MKKLILPIIMLLFIACSDDETSTENENTCLCSNETEYVCWEQNGTNRETISTISDFYEEYSAHNFGGSEFYGSIDNSHINLKHIFKLPLKLNFEYDSNGEGEVTGQGGDLLNTGVWGGIYSNNSTELDTIFKDLKVKILENTSSYFRGKFECSEVFTLGSTSDGLNDSIYDHSLAFEIKKGCFKVLK